MEYQQHLKLRNWKYAQIFKAKVLGYYWKMLCFAYKLFILAVYIDQFYQIVTTLTNPDNP